MKKYNPVDYNRTIWYDKLRTKNHPRKCKQSHNFCTLDYEWSDLNLNLHHMNTPINTTIPNITLPTNADRQQFNYEQMTEETIDDWIAQSMNRTLNSMLNPNKKYFVPPSLDEELKNRYKKEKKNLKIQPDDTYFKTRKISSAQKSYLNHKKNKTIDMSDLIIDYKRLEAKPPVGKTPISARQKLNNPPKQQIKRRNAVLLEKDLHYERFIKDKRASDPDQKSHLIDDKKIIETLNKNKLFTLNYDSLRRKKMNDQTPCSITEYDGIHIHMPNPKFSLQKQNNLEQRKQEEQQEMYRLKGNAQAEQAYSIMENFSTTKTRFSHRTKVSFSEEKNGQEHKVKMGSTFSLYDPIVRILTNRTEKKLKEKDEKQRVSMLGKKVIKLLEQMHVESQNINAEMAKFELHPEFIPLTFLSPTLLSHKWISKAQHQLQLSRFQTAFQCYKQAIISDSQLFNPVYNFASLLQRQNRFNCSLSWFKLAKQFESDNERVTFAIALINLKMEKFEECEKEINSLINELSSDKRKVDPKYYYIRAMCSKKLGKYDAAKKDYRLVLEHSRAENSDDLAKFVLSYIFAKKRRYIPHVSPLAYTKIRQMVYLTLYEKGPNLAHQGDLYLQMSQKIKDFHFFRRFPPKLVEKLVKVSMYEYHHPNQVIFVKPDECVIVLDGLIVVKNHQKNVFVHDVVCLLKQGDFIGANAIDNYRNFNLNNWCFTHTHVELLRMKSEQFESFWKGQMTIEFDEKYNRFRNNPLFSGLSEAVLFKLCEIMNVKTVKKGEVIFNDGSYRAKTVGKDGCGFSLLHNSLTDPTEIPPPFNNTNQQQNSNPIKPFTQLIFQGLYIIKQGRIEIQDDKGFSNSNIIGENDFFGQNLIIQSDGFNNYGRLIVVSQEAEFYVLEMKDLIWCFSAQDKEIMTKNCKDMERRKSLELVRDLRRRYYEYLEVKEKICARQI